MSRLSLRGAVLVLVMALTSGCAGEAEQSPVRAETFTWVAQPISFSPPPPRWERQGDNGGGTIGVRFILTGGGGQCISVVAYREFAERDRRRAIARFISRRDSITGWQFQHELSLVRARTDDPLSDREATTALAINDALDRALTDYLADSPNYVAADLDAAERAADAYEPTLEEALPAIRLRPERMQEPQRWRIGCERDTTLAGQPAFASDDTLITPERPLLYREIYWVVHGCAFKAVYQGTSQHLDTFRRVVDSIRFPEGGDTAPQ